MDEFGLDADDGQYAYGVVLGIGASRRQSPVMTPEYLVERYSLPASRGYEDASALISKVLRYEDAPSGEYLDLLSAPHGEPLAQ